MVFVAVVLILQPIRRFVRRMADRFVYGPQSMSYEALARFTRQIADATTESRLPSCGGRSRRPAGECAGLHGRRQPGGRRADRELVGRDGDRSACQLEMGAVDLSRWPSRRQAGARRCRITRRGPARRHGLLASFAEQVAGAVRPCPAGACPPRQALDLDQLNRSLEHSRQRLLAARDIGRRQVADRIRDEVVTGLRR